MLNSETINVANLPIHTKVENIFGHITKNQREGLDLQYADTNGQLTAFTAKGEDLYPVAMRLTENQKERETLRQFISRAIKIAGQYESAVFGFSNGNVALVVTREEFMS